uniref:BED-type domain-containing protein n=1 Tax=Meloidogyne hapla TaxID=6305 RepID=A0A1I8B885_MELHA
MSKYSKYFNIGESSKCLNCDYIYNPKRTAEKSNPRTALRYHLKSRHPALFKELCEYEGEQNKACTSKNDGLKQSSLKRICEPSTSSTQSKIPISKQPRIDTTDWSSDGEKTKPIDAATTWVQNRNSAISAFIPLFKILERKMNASKDADFQAVRTKIANSLSERIKGFKLSFINMQDIFRMGKQQKFSISNNSRPAERDSELEFVQSQHEERNPFSEFLEQQNLFDAPPPLAQKSVDVKAKAAGCERLFSSANFVLDERRMSLSGDNLEQQLYLHHNLLIYDFIYD